jgi:hypothetical protein
MLNLYTSVLMMQFLHYVTCDLSVASAARVYRGVPTSARRTIASTSWGEKTFFNTTANLHAWHGLFVRSFGAISYHCWRTLEWVHTSGIVSAPLWYPAPPHLFLTPAGSSTGPGSGGTKPSGTLHMLSGKSVRCNKCTRLG